MGFHSKLTSKKTALYRHLDAAGALLYVGISLSAITRLSQHAASAWSTEISSVTIENFDNRNDAIEAEKNAIKSERPKYNKQHALKQSAHNGRPDDDVINGPIHNIGRDKSPYFREVYSVRLAAMTLDITTEEVRKLIEDGEISHFVHSTHIKHGRETPNYRITGWAMMDYLNEKEAEYSK